MKALADALFLCVVGLIVLAIGGGDIARCLDAVAVPGCLLLGALIVARLVWFYTSRW